MEELNQALAKLIEQATTGIDASVGFLQAELPDVVYQLLSWNLIIHAVYFVMSICLLGVAFLAVRFVFMGHKKTHPDKKLGEYENGEQVSRFQHATVTEYQHSSNHTYITYDDGSEFLIGTSIVASIVSVVIAALSMNLVWLKILIAPKVWLIEYAANLVK